MEFTVGASGRITHAATTGPEASPAVGACVTARLRNLPFPTPGHGSASFTFAFTFLPRN